MNPASDPVARTSYRHGDLRETLIAAGLEMAKSGGPDAVVLREATRQAGVSPNAAYRHFADRQALLNAVSDAALGLSADRIEAAIAAIEPTDDAATLALAHLRAVGTGYLAFAREEPGLFRVAYSVPDNLRNSMSPSKAGAGGHTPFGLLSSALDLMADAGILPPERRQNAELLAWSAVHGLGMLVIDGPLRGLDDTMIDGATSRLIDMVERGL
jgi:AcrR family transcriptional regulator